MKSNAHPSPAVAGAAVRACACVCVRACVCQQDVSEPTVHLKLATTHTLNSTAPRDAGSVGAGGAAGAGAGVSSGHGKPFTMEVGLDKFRVLHNELKQARLLMKSL